MRDDELSRKLNKIVGKAPRRRAEPPPAAEDAALVEVAGKLITHAELRRRMRARELFDRLGVIIEEIQRLDKDWPPGETNPLIHPLLDEGRAIQRELDPIVRETYRDDPAALAEWDEIMHMCDDLDEEDAAKQSSPPAKKKPARKK